MNKINAILEEARLGKYSNNKDANEDVKSILLTNNSLPPQNHENNHIIQPEEKTHDIASNNERIDHCNITSNKEQIDHSNANVHTDHNHEETIIQVPTAYQITVCSSGSTIVQENSQ